MERNKLKVWGTKSSRDNLCKYCKDEFAVCNIVNAHVAFGDGIGDDNVIECSEFVLKISPAIAPIYEKPGPGINKVI